MPLAAFARREDDGGFTLIAALGDAAVAQALEPEGTAPPAAAPRPASTPRLSPVSRAPVPLTAPPRVRPLSRPPEVHHDWR